MSIQFSSFTPGKHKVNPIPFKAHKVVGLSDKLLESHYENNYGGAVRRLNAIEEQLAEVDWQAAKVFDINGIKREELVAANSMILHEVYFDSIGEEGGVPLNNQYSELISAVNASFGSLEQWESEFTAMAKALAGGSGWVVLAWSEHDQRLINQWANEHNHNLAGSTPILALDMYEHAYHIDFGSNAGAYVDAILQNIHWGRVNKRFLDALNKQNKVTNTDNNTHQIDVCTLKQMLEEPDKKPYVLDVRHVEDKERSGMRILETPWKDSFTVAKWAHELPKNSPIVIYCMYGFWVSQNTVSELRDLGYDAYFLEGGIAAWRAMGFPSSPVQH